jgi:agmatinase
MSFDPNATGSADAGIFGFPFTKEDAKLILIPIPWEVTTSYGSGTSLGPASVYECSRQIDVMHPDTGTAYEKGIYWWDDGAEKIKTLNDELKPFAREITKSLERGEALPSELVNAQNKINMTSQKINGELYDKTLQLLKNNKLVGVVGGDHSSPLGAIQAVVDHYKNDVAILHIDAHADLRKSYQGYKHSHASIMRNVMDGAHPPKHLVQVGIRDYCPEENDYLQSHQKITMYFDRDLKRLINKGHSWAEACSTIVASLDSENIYVSFDIDGLDPALCPGTGTPVPGGLSYDQAVDLLNTIVNSNKRIVGFDLCEVTPSNPEVLDCWDGNVGARVLYNLCCYTLFKND